MPILVTGGAGYIGSHTCLELLKSHEIVVLDNLSNSTREALRRVQILAGKKLCFYQEDIRNEAVLHHIFQNHKINGVIHFAGLKAIGESITNPQLYYENNICGTLTLTRVMSQYHCRNIIFSSSATVYGDPAFVPITEDCPKGNCTNPYGWTKWMVEQILTDLHHADPAWNIVLLRYFNPIGAHPSGQIGEDPKGIPSNLLPYVSQVAYGKLPVLKVFGKDYPTPDGTGIRDYIHVSDLARGHVAALERLRGKPGVRVYNLGTGKGYSVLEIVAAFERVCGHKIPYQFEERRAGDIAMCYCDPGKAERELGWRAQYNIDDMCRDFWRWQQQNPDGYCEADAINGKQ